MNVHPARDVDYRDAEKVLVLYLKAKNLVIKNCREWARWTYGDIPFWSVWGIVCGSGDKVVFEVCGIQIYDDGRVLIVASDKDMEKFIGQTTT